MVVEGIKEIVEAEAEVAEVVAVGAAEMAIGFALTRGRLSFFFFFRVFYLGYIWWISSIDLGMGIKKFRSFSSYKYMCY